MSNSERGRGVAVYSQTERRASCAFLEGKHYSNAVTRQKRSKQERAGYQKPKIAAKGIKRDLYPERISNLRIRMGKRFLLI
jgi:hypothetical protein